LFNNKEKYLKEIPIEDLLKERVSHDKKSYNNIDAVEYI